MEYLIGVILSLAVAGFAAVIGFDRERSFYPTVLIVIASYYVLFAAMGASRRTLIIEIVVASGFLLVAVLGYRRNFWLVPLRDLLSFAIWCLSWVGNRVEWRGKTFEVYRGGKMAEVSNSGSFVGQVNSAGMK